MNLIDYTLTYRRDGETEPAITIERYYSRFVQPLDSDFQKASFENGSKLVLCCFHDDLNPSLGLINHKTLKGVKIYHCFGCNAVGTVVRMHQHIERAYHKRTLTEEESARELCKLFDVPLDTTAALAAQNELQGLAARLYRVAEGMDNYTLFEFRQDLRRARNPEMSVRNRLQHIHAASVKLIATKKDLFEK